MKVRQLLLISSLFAAVASLTACHNYTVAPVCNEGNAAIPPGISGQYTLSTQDEHFNVQTTDITVGVSSNGRMKKLGMNDGESQLCQINGQFIAESYDQDVKAYEQNRIYVSGTGLTQAPVFFDKAALDAAGIANKVFEVPQAGAKVMGKLTARMKLILLTQRRVGWSSIIEI